MSIDIDLLDRLMEGRSPGDLFGKTGILSELTKALAERALSTEMDVHLDGERIDEMTQRSPNPPGVFVLHDGMGLVAKRLEFIPMSDPPRVRIISDNQQYSTYDGTADEVNIIGRVRWYGREM